MVVTGTGFATGDGLTPLCRFGDVVVPATVLNSATLTCIAPPNIGRVAFALSFDGSKFTEDELFYQYPETFVVSKWVDELPATAVYPSPPNAQYAAWDVGDVFATATAEILARMRFFNYSLQVPLMGSTIDGIEVELEVSTSGEETFVTGAIGLSRNGNDEEDISKRGSVIDGPFLPQTTETLVYGSPDDLWNGEWTAEVS